VPRLTRVPVSFSSLLKTTEQLLALLFKWMTLAGLVIYGLGPQIIYCDVPWHLAQGQWMIDHFHFLRHDVFNYPNLNAPIINEYSFYQVLLWIIYRAGEWGAAIACAALLFIMFWLYFRAISRSGGLTLLPCVAIFAAVPLSVQRLILRPELVTDLGIVFFMTFLLEHRNETSWKKFWPLFLFQVAWVNSHSGFIRGPALVWGFAFESVLRASWGQKKKAWTAAKSLARTWLPVCLVISVCCLINPYGFSRLWLPFYHQSSNIIRAYVTEMQPLEYDPNNFFVKLMLLDLFLLLVAIFMYRGRISWTFLLITLYFYEQTFITRRHMVIFGLLVPGVIISGRYLNENSGPAWKWLQASPVLRIAGLFIIMLGSFLFIAAEMQDSDAGLSLSVRWHALHVNHTEYPIEATGWMRRQNVEGRLIHRSEIGGWLQYVGYNHGETYADTGFGKYSQKLIHEIGLACERPGYLPWLFKKYQPDFAVVACNGYNWPASLRHQGWRCIFYAPSGSVWTWGSRRPDLKTVSHQEIADTITQSLKKDGVPAQLSIYYRSLLALESMGLDDIAFPHIGDLPPSALRDSLFWVFAECYCFEEAGAAPAHVEALYRLATMPEYNPCSLLFRTRYLLSHHRYREVINEIEPVFDNMYDDPLMITLTEACLAEGQFDRAFSLLLSNHLFDVKNGHRWELLAECEERAGDVPAAAECWKKALFFYPDDASIRRKAAIPSSSVVIPIPKSIKR
jgi:hypothetical protein